MLDFAYDGLEHMLGKPARDCIVKKISGISRTTVGGWERFVNTHALNTMPRASGPTPPVSAAHDKDIRRRNGVAAVLLMQLVAGTRDLGSSPASDGVLNKTMSEIKEALRELVKGFCPALAIAGEHIGLSGREDWDPGQFSDPMPLASGKFCYLIHGLNPGHVMLGQRHVKEGKVIEHSDYAQEHANYDKATKKIASNYLVTSIQEGRGHQIEQVHLFPLKLYLDNPNLLTYDLISCSLIDQDHTTTYHQLGFILEVPADCIWATSVTDMSIPNRLNPMVDRIDLILMGYYLDYGIAPPGDLLTRTGGGHNEVVALGTSTGGKTVRVKALFVKVTPDGMNLAPHQANKPEITKEVGISSRPQPRRTAGRS